MDLTRRDVLTSTAAGIAAVTLAEGAAQAAADAAFKKYKNADFYAADGTFLQDKAKQAFYEMMEFYHYPVVPRLKTAEFWVADFGLGKFMEVGMGGIFWVNNQKDNYFGHEIYLLPGQMIPEHKHVKTEAAGPKLEAWQGRHGWVYLYGEGPATPGVEERIPPSHKECCVAKAEKKLMPGEVAELAGAEQWHWMKAGPDGGIVTEYATYHDGKGLRFSNSQVKM